MSSTASHFVIWVVLDLPRQHEPLVTRATSIQVALTNNPYFPNPTPAPGALGGHIDAYRQSVVKASTRVKGAVAEREANMLTVVQDLHHSRDYVQSVVEKETSPATAAVMVESVGMRLRAPRKRVKAELSVYYGPVSGTVVLSARTVAPVATYYWEHSLDQQTWTRSPDTLKAKTMISGLIPARIYYFRFRALTRTGETDYSQVVSLLVH